MPSPTLDEKISKVVKLLMGSTDRQIAELLGRRGFSGDDRAEGWALFDRVVGRAFPVPLGGEQGMPKSKTKPIIKHIDEWENIWFEVADAALSRRYPSVGDTLLGNLNRASGLSVVVNVGAFVSRYHQLASRLDEESTQAVSLLTKRGLTPKRVAEAETLLESLKEMPSTDAPAADDEPALKKSHEEAISKMWAWYQEWSRLARSVITNRHQLIALGLANRRPKRPRDKKT